MKRLYNTNLYVGTMDDLSEINNEEWVVVHATQTVHYQIFNWDRKFNKPNQNHPNYIFYENGNRVSLNWVDGPARLYDWSGPETFIKVLDFIDKWIGEKKVLVHCDQGLSRSPSICLLYLSKRTDNLPASSFIEARNKFVEEYPRYNPSGIADYIEMNWNRID